MRLDPASAFDGKPIYYGPDQEHPYGSDELRRLLQSSHRSMRIARPRPASGWCEENLSLDAMTSPGAGGRMRLYGYQKEPLDSMCDNTVKRVVVEKSARVGYSLITTCAALYYLAHEAVPVAYTTQNKPKAEEWLKTNFNPFFKHPDNKILHRIVRAPKKGEDLDELFDRYFRNGAMFRARTAASDDSFRGYRCKRAIADEVDANTWRPIGKNSQGNKLEMYRDRHAEYFDGGMIIGGTPTHLHSSLVHANFLKTDQRRYFVPCPHCAGAAELPPAERDAVTFEMDVDRPEVSGFQHLEFTDGGKPYGIKFDIPDDRTKPIERAYYQCRHCGSEIDEYEAATGYSWKAWMDRHGEWRPTNGTWRRGERPGEWIAVESDAQFGWRGYHVWAGYSCAEGVTWLAIAQQFLLAVRSGAKELQAFENLWLGRPWEARMSFAVPTPSKLSGMTVCYPGECPDDVIFATLTADVQAGTEDGSKPARLECQYVGHGRRDTAIVLDYIVLDKYLPFSPQADRILDELRARVFVTPSGRKVKVMATGIDRSFNPGAVLNYCSPRWKERCFAIRGDAAKDGKPKDSIVSKAPNVDPRKGQWFTVDTISAKLEFFQKLQFGVGLGGLVIPRSLAYYSGYLEGLLAEKPRMLDNGYTVFEHKKSTPNESLDTLCYSFALREIVKNTVKGYADNNLDLLADAMGVPATLTVFDTIEEDRSVLAPVVAQHALAQQIVEMPGVEDHASVRPQAAPEAPRFRPVREPASARPTPADPQDPDGSRSLGRPQVRVRPSPGGRPNWGRR